MTERITSEDAFSAEQSCSHEASELINANSALVYGLAKRFEGRGTEREELIQSGFVGLACAAKSFDASKGAAFSSYAFKFVEGAIRECIRKNRLIAVPRSEYAALSELAAFSCAERTAEAENELSKKRFEIDARAGTVPISRFSSGGEDGETPLNELAVYAGFEEECISGIFVRSALSKLEALERSVMILRYFQEKTQVETAKLLKISQSAVSKKEKAALLKLRALLEN